MSFRFRRFVVEDSRSTMKVGTDAVLLGSWVQPGSASAILDIGTGCGVIALMVAQGSSAKIDAIDIHRPSVDEATFNVSQSPWADRIRVYCRSVEEHARLVNHKYDIIVSNPPFFFNSLKPSSEVRLLAKHEDALSPAVLLRYSIEMMHPGSSLCLIMPVREGNKLTIMAAEKGLYPARRIDIRSLPSKPPHRSLFEFRWENVHKKEVDELVIRSSEGLFSEKYLSMTQNFHLFNQNKS